MDPDLEANLKNRRLTFIQVPAAANLGDGEDRDIMTPRIITAKHKGRQTTTQQRTKEN